MAHPIVEKLKAVISDLLSSWYFRLWLFFAVFCFVMGVTAFFEISVTSTEYDLEHNVHIWTEKPSSMNFPPFQFRIHTSEPIQFVSNTSAIVCYHSGQPVLTQPCGNNVPIEKCRAVGAGGLVSASNDNFRDEAIFCEMMTTVVDFQKYDTFMAFQILGDPMEEGTAYFGPNNQTWITLEKSSFHDYKTKRRFDLWNKQLTYHSTQWSAGKYRVVVMIGNFVVINFAMDNTNIHEMVAVADIGGFAYFMLIMHTIAMTVVGLFFVNDSKYLNHQV